jgi:hypothetical protein
VTQMALLLSVGTVAFGGAALGAPGQRPHERVLGVLIWLLALVGVVLVPLGFLVDVVRIPTLYACDAVFGKTVDNTDRVLLHTCRVQEYKRIALEERMQNLCPRELKRRGLESARHYAARQGLRVAAFPMVPLTDDHIACACGHTFWSTYPLTACCNKRPDVYYCTCAYPMPGQCAVCPMCQALHRRQQKGSPGMNRN